MSQEGVLASGRGWLVGILGRLRSEQTADAILQLLQREGLLDVACLVPDLDVLCR